MIEHETAIRRISITLDIELIGWASRERDAGAD